MRTDIEHIQQTLGLINRVLTGDHGDNGLAGRLGKLEQRVGQLGQGWSRVLDVLMSVAAGVCTGLLIGLLR